VNTVVASHVVLPRPLPGEANDPRPPRSPLHRSPRLALFPVVDFAQSNCPSRGFFQPQVSIFRGFRVDGIFEAPLIEVAPVPPPSAPRPLDQE